MCFDGKIGAEEGFEISGQMGFDGIELSEAAFTGSQCGELAGVMEDPKMWFDSVKQMKSCDIPPKLQ